MAYMIEKWVNPYLIHYLQQNNNHNTAFAKQNNRFFFISDTKLIKLIVFKLYEFSFSKRKAIAYENQMVPDLTILICILLENIFSSIMKLTNIAFKTPNAVKMEI